MIAPEMVKEVFHLNQDGSLIWLKPSKYHSDLVGKQAGVIARNHSGKWYWLVQINGRKVRRSWIVFCLTYGRWPSEQIDHINGDSLDDRPVNLREATATQNAWNHKFRAKKAKTPMGVRCYSPTRFCARIGVNKKQIHLGIFPTLAEAVAAYQSARLRYFGEFA